MIDEERPAVMAMAWLNVGLHGVGLALAVVGMRPGSMAVALSERVAYLAGRPLAWSLGWAVWMLCALALVAFVAAVAPLLPGRRFAAGLALSLVGAGAAVDLTCDTLYIVLLPTLAAVGPTPLFLAAERALGAGGVVVANGLYSLAVLLITLSLPQTAGRSCRALGYGTFAAGMVMVAGGFANHSATIEAATGPTIVLFMAWTLTVARRLGDSGREIEKGKRG